MLAEVAFVDTGSTRGIQSYEMADGMGAGVAAVYFDLDGWIDLFAPTDHGVPSQLYRNQGDGTFEEIAGAVGLASLDNAKVGLWVDYDGDGDLDLAVAHDAFSEPAAYPDSTLRLFEQQTDGTFIDVTEQAGLAGDLLDGTGTHAGGLTAGDLNNDGYLDLVLTFWHGTARVFLNNANVGTPGFTDISFSSGIAGTDQSIWQSLIFDANGDGWQDIFMSVDFAPNHLWINQQNLTFCDAAEAAGVDNAFNEMGASRGDYDGDGDFDIYITNIAFEGKHEDRYNLLYRNDTTGGIPEYVNVSLELGVGFVDWGWGVTFHDANLDGWVDLAVTNGFDTPTYVTDQSRYFLHGGATPPAFTDVSSAVGFNDTDYGSCVVAADIDRNGAVDLVQTCNLDGPLRLLDNVITGEDAFNGYLVVKPRMAGPNRFAIGAIVEIRADGLSQIRQISAGTSMFGQEPAEAFFGLAGAAVVERILVRWPDGRVSGWADTPGNGCVTVADDTAVTTCDADIDFPPDGMVSISDLLVILAAWGTNTPDADIAADDGVVDVQDLLLLLELWGDCPG